MINWKGNKYAERLVEEWRKYGKIVLAVDFDDTLSPWGFKQEENAKDYARSVEIIKLAQELGAHTVIWTACDETRFDYIREYCEKLGVRVDSINENPIELPYGKHKKVYYNILLDDRAGLEQSLSMLEWAYWVVKTSKEGRGVDANFDV